MTYNAIFLFINILAIIVAIHNSINGLYIIHPNVNMIGLGINIACAISCAICLAFDLNMWYNKKTEKQ